MNLQEFITFITLAGMLVNNEPVYFRKETDGPRLLTFRLKFKHRSTEDIGMIHYCKNTILYCSIVVKDPRLGPKLLSNVDFENVLEHFIR